MICTLGGCNQMLPQPLEPSAGHIPVDPVISATNIPDLVEQTPVLPEPETPVQTAKYTVVVNEVPVKEILFALARNGRLPCPDCPDGNAPCNAVAAANRNDGIEDRSGSTPNRVCVVTVGNLPWVDLQVGQFDAWNRHFTYQATPAFTRESNSAPCGTPATGVSFEVCTPGDIDIYAAYVSPPLSGNSYSRRQCSGSCGIAWSGYV